MMLIYPISFFISLSGLIAWFYLQGKGKISRRASQIFLGGFVVYLISLGAAEATLSYKLLILFRDCAVLGLVTFFFSFFRKNKIAFFALLFLAYGLFGTWYFGQMMQTFSSEKPLQNLAEKGELLVELKPNQSIDDLSAFFEQYGIEASRAFHPEDPAMTDLDDYFLINIPAKHLSKLAEIEDELRQNPAVEYLEENEIIKVSPSNAVATSQDTRFPINDPQLNKLWGFDEMDMVAFYDKLATKRIKKKALVVILDTGVDAQHEDLKANYFSIERKSDNDPQGHGTHCAGIAAAVANNGKGIAAFSPTNEHLQVSSIKVLNSFGMGTQEKIIDGILKAADNDADVISMSLGGRSSDTKQKAYKKAVAYAQKKGAIVVVAAGNENTNAKNYAPANAEGVITVSAIDEGLNRASFSNQVQDIEWAVAAPGVNIYSTFPKDQYKSMNGTSMATPYVAGLLGIMKSIRPSLTTKEAFLILNTSGKKTKSSATTGKFIQPLEVLDNL